MSASPRAKTVLALVEPAVQHHASRLFILTSERKGSQKHKPAVTTFFETGLVTNLYETLLMSPLLTHLDIRQEMPYHESQASPNQNKKKKGAPKQVDLWWRPWNGGRNTLLEVGFWNAPKVLKDLNKTKQLNPKGSNWFLAFFRDQQALKEKEVAEIIGATYGTPKSVLGRADIKWNPELTTKFEVYRPNGDHDWFGAALFQIT